MKTREAKMCIVACECDPASQVPCPSFSPKCPSGQVFQGSPSGHSNPKHSLLVGSPVNYPAHLVTRRGDIQAGIASQDLSRTCPAHSMILSPRFFPLPDLTLQGCVLDYVKHYLGSRPSRPSMPTLPPRVLAFFL